MKPACRILLWTFAAAWFAWSGFACGGVGGGASHTSPDGGSDADVATPLDGDVAQGDVTSDVGPADVSPDLSGWDPPPVAPETEPEAIQDVQWRMMYVGNKADPVIGDLITGNFTWPAEGVTDDGYWWQDKAPEENGIVTGPSNGLLLYVVARFELDAPAGVIVRNDAVYQVFLNGARQPGDPYAHHYHRVALRGQTGENLVVFRIIGSGRTPEIELWTTPDEVAFNLADVTRPDLVAHEAGSQALGIATLNLTDAPLLDVRARVVENEYLEETVRRYPALGTLSATQVGFELRAKSTIDDADIVVPVTLRVESPSLAWSYERTIEITSVSDDPASPKNIRRGFFDPADDSAQYYGLLRAAEPDDGDGRALLLSLHGAGVQGIGQAGSYSPKADMVVVAPTNRRPFGFDWEVWGRLNGMHALEHAKSTLTIDPTRVYVSGHSMGGHGTWQFGVLFPGRFAVVGPSAGWVSFATYGQNPAPFPTGPFGWARHSSDTLRFVDNLIDRAVYIIHGTADDNVPISQAFLMLDHIEDIVPDLQTHFEPGAGHWWDGDASPGADCVDWPPLIATMDARTLDPYETDFTFVSPSPWVNPHHSWLTLESAQTPAQDMRADAIEELDTVTLNTLNVRSLSIDTVPLMDRGISSIIVDGTPYMITGDVVHVGPTTGKNPEVYGPVHQVFFRPFCFVYDPGGHPEYRRFADYLTSAWLIIGNGHACTLPMDALTPEIRAERNLIYLGFDSDELDIPDSLDTSWNAASVSVGGAMYTGGYAYAVAFPEGDRLSAAIGATANAESLLYSLSPFTSRFVIPDYLVYTTGGSVAVGFYDGDWAFDPALGSFAQ